MNILLLDDSPVNLKVALCILEIERNTVAIAANGRAALARWERQAFDLILMDAQMPVMDALAVTAAIRRAEAGPAGMFQLLP